jgi:hypothetical protein
MGGSERTLPVKDEQPSPTRQTVTTIQSLVQGRLQVSAEHGRNRTRLLENGRPLGQLARAVPSPKQSGVSRKRAGFKQAAEETQSIKLERSQSHHS